MYNNPNSPDYHSWATNDSGNSSLDTTNLRQLADEEAQSQIEIPSVAPPEAIREPLETDSAFTSSDEDFSIKDLTEVLSTTIKYDNTNKAIVFLAALTTYTEQDQLNIMLVGPSSSGKTYIVQEVMKYFPTEDILQFDSVSPTAFKYYNQSTDEKTGETFVDLERKILVFSEMPNFQLVANLRPLLSHDRKIIEALTTDRSTAGRGVARHTKIKGYPTTFFCSAYTRMDEQESTRALQLSPESSQEKLEAGVALANERNANPIAFRKKIEGNPARIALKKRIEIIKGLNIQSVIIPNPKEVLEKYTEIMSTLAPRSQRDIGHLHSLIKAVAMLNAERRMDENRNVIATNEDIIDGVKLWANISRTQSLGIPPVVYSFYTDFVIPAYKHKTTLRKNEEQFIEDGVTLSEITAYYSELTGLVYNTDTLRKLTMPTLVSAGIVNEEKSPLDARRKLYKPILEV